MNPVHEQIVNKILKPELGKRHHMTLGRVLSYDNVHNLATVEVDDPIAGGKTILDRVPVQMQGGMSASAPYEGDEVWITFMGGSYLHPRITGFGDMHYSVNIRESRLRHQRKGAMIPDSIMRWS